MEVLNVGKNNFEVVESIPQGYIIWNIGKNMIDGYLPIVEMDSDGYSVNIATMKAIKVDEAQVILSAIGGGQNTIESMERYIKRYKNAKGAFTRKQVERISKALPIMKSIKWE